MPHPAPIQSRPLAEGVQVSDVRAVADGLGGYNVTFTYTVGSCFREHVHETNISCLADLGRATELFLRGVRS